MALLFAICIGCMCCIQRVWTMNTLKCEALIYPIHIECLFTTWSQQQRQNWCVYATKCSSAWHLISTHRSIFIFLVRFFLSVSLLCSVCFFYFFCFVSDLLPIHSSVSFPTNTLSCIFYVHICFTYRTEWCIKWIWKMWLKTVHIGHQWTVKQTNEFKRWRQRPTTARQR